MEARRKGELSSPGRRCSLGKVEERERERGYSESAEFVNEKGGNERAKQARFSNREANSFRRNEGKEGRGRNGRILIKKKERKKGRFSTSLRMVIRIAEEEEGIN